MPQQGHQQQPPQPAAPQPSGPGADGIDWEAEAAALDAPQTPRVVEPESGQWADHEVEAFEEPEQESFFGEQDDSRSAERNRKEKGKKSGRKNSGACLVVALVLLGGVAGAGWWGYGFYQQHFGPPPDFTGTGSGSVQIEIKPGAVGESMGATLKAAGVVKSVDAFISAFNKNPKANTIQPGFFTLHHQMAASEAVKVLVDAAGGNALIVPEGKTAAVTYGLIDGKLKLAPGTTANVAKTQVASLGLPPYANGNIEGFLYPTKYSISQGMKPEDLLKQMVSTATQHYQDLNLDAGAQKIGLKSGYEVLTAASILQAEGNNSADFGKIARVISNRLSTPATQGKLQLDTTLQYKLGRTKFTVAEKDGDKSPYNTYVNKGLPPTPISNPGDDAIKAMLDPTPGDWVYFVALSPQETRFAVTFEAFKKDVKDYCSANKQGFDEAAGMCKS
ncbi:endolytic transglycosylase MltG [Kitasatospora sp. CMC57]|uniref:Endolytic murein transglycosylase n=1 Tax=Kitasatospora sp. CMC57 TaxID=3231513 RepID=A0AB33JSV8_9ACTN